jgi:signal-transduction protein with cAMP-binding, CBS, and nucleotidyltransferase domain
MSSSPDGSLATEAASFLARWPPFDELDMHELEDLASESRLASYRPGSEILRQAADPAPALYVVKGGIVDLFEEDRFVGRVDQGEIFGLSVLSGLGPSMTVRARGDVQCYLIPPHRARALLGAPAGLAFLAAQATRWRERDAAEEHVRRTGTDTDLTDSIRGGSDVAALVTAWERLPSLVRSLLDRHVDPIDIGHVVGVGIDELTRRLIELSVVALGEAPASYAWLALGSAARHEQGLVTDQDHAMAFGGDDAGVEVHDRYFSTLAKAVTDGLEACGIARCHGNVMAENPAWRRTSDGWRRRFAVYLADPNIMGARITGIAFDYRRVAGDVDIERVLDGVIRETRNDRAFMGRLAATVMETRPAVGRRRDLVLERGGAHAGKLDVKHGGITVVTNLARLLALRAGIAENRTVERLRGAAASGAISDRARDDLVEAFRLLWRVRLEHHVGQIERGEEPDDFVDPAELDAVSRGSLATALSVVAGAQKTLAG